MSEGKKRESAWLDCFNELESLISLSLQQNGRSVAHFCATTEEYATMRQLLLEVSDRNCQLEPVGGQGYSGPEAKGGVRGWGRNDDGAGEIWTVEIFRN